MADKLDYGHPYLAERGLDEATIREFGVGFCNAGPSRRQGPRVGELYEIYIVDQAKRYGLGRELFEGTTGWCRARQMSGRAGRSRHL